MMADIRKNLQEAYDNEKECDVRLILQSGKELLCHSLVLKISSGFFKAQFSDNWNHENAVQCPNFDDATVVAMTDYMYGKHINMNKHNIEIMVSCASYYVVTDLQNKCQDFIISNLSEENAFTFLNIASVYSLDNIIELILEYIDSVFEKAVHASEDFQRLSEQLVILIIKRNTVWVHEEVLMDFLIEWVDGQQNCAVWKRLSTHIRFHTMSLEYYVRSCVKNEVLQASANDKMLLYLCSSETTSDDLAAEGLNTTSRQIKKADDKFVLRLPSSSQLPTWQQSSLDGDRIAVEVDREIKLKAVSIFGNGTQFVNLTLYKDSVIVSQTQCRIDFNDNKTNLIPLKHSHILLPNNLYTLHLKCEGANTYFGENGLETNCVILDDSTRVVLKFSTASGNSSVTVGQFHGLLLCK